MIQKGHILKSKTINLARFLLPVMILAAVVQKCKCIWRRG